MKILNLVQVLRKPLQSGALVLALIASQFALMAAPASATGTNVTSITGVNFNNANLSTFTSSGNAMLVSPDTYYGNMTVYLTNSGESISNVVGTAGDSSAISWDDTYQQGIAVNISLSNLVPGINQIVVTVMASNGVTTQDYTYYINDPAGSSSYNLVYDANLPACQSKQNHKLYTQGIRDLTYCQYTEQGIPQNSVLNGSAQVVQNPNNTYRGYRFEKWTTNQDGTGTSYYPGSTINPPLTGDFTLYAQYTANPTPSLVLTSNNANVLPTKLDNPGPSVTFTATEKKGADVVGDNGTLVTLLLNSAIIPNTGTNNPRLNYTCTLNNGTCSITVNLPDGNDVYSAYVDGSATWFSATSNTLSYYVKQAQTITLANTNSSSNWAGSAATGYTDSFARGSTYSATTPTDGDTVARNAPSSTYTSGSADTFAFSVSSAGATGCTINSDGSGLAAAASGTCVISVAATNTDGYFNSVTQTLTLTVTPPKAVITITSTKPTSPAINTNPYVPTGTSTSTLNVTIGVSTPSICTIGAGIVQFHHVGTCTITYNDAGDVNYSAATQVTENITVTQATAVITADGSQSGALTGGTFTSAASSTSGETVVVASTTPLICTVSSGVVTYVGVGTCHLTYNDAGNADYSAATQASLDITVNKGTATITIGNAVPGSSYSFGTYTPSPTSNSGDSVTITSSTPLVCTESGGVISYLAVGTCTLTYSDFGNANYNAATNVVQNITVLQVQAVITVGVNAPNAPALNSTYTPAATSTSSNSVVLVSTTTGKCTVAGGVVTFLHPGTCTLTFDDAGNVNYSAASTVTINITIPKLANTVTTTSTAPSGPVAGATYHAAATATSTLAVVISTSTPQICTVVAGVVTFNHAGTCNVNFDQGGNATYDAASTVTQSITVNKAVAVITFSNSVPEHLYKSGSYNPAAVSTSGETVVLATTTPSTCSVAAGVIYFVELGNCNVTFDDAGNADYSAAAQVSHDFIVEVINVTYDANGATGSVPVDSNTYVTATLVHVLGNFGSPQLTRTGYVFTGWCTTFTSFTTCTDGTFYAAGVQFPVTGAERLYSQWALAVPTTTLNIGPTSGVAGVPLVLSPSIGTNTGATYTVANGTAHGCTMTRNIVSATSAGTCLVTFTRNGITVRQTITFGNPAVSRGALFGQVFFGDMKTALTSQSVTTLTNLALEIIAKHLKVVTVTGYASALGSKAYNLKLSAQRAANVAKYLKSILVAAGYPAIQVKITGQGASKANPTYALNREVIVRG
jgi:OmpA family/Listeria-Bacteroides repeat domain (List_Bact_rpt)